MSNTPSPAEVQVEPESGSEEVYCVCRKGDDGSFMIQCDACSIWYHGHCVGLTARQGHSMDSYQCPPCAGLTWDQVEPLHPKRKHSQSSAYASDDASPTDKKPRESKRSQPSAPVSKNRLSAHLQSRQKRHAASETRKIQSPDTVRPLARKLFEKTFQAILEDVKTRPQEYSLDGQMELNDPKALAEKVEQELFTLLAVTKPGTETPECGKAYKEKYRSLQFNLKDAKNIRLRERLLRGEITPATLIRLPSEELGSEDMKAAAESIQQSSLKTVFKPVLSDKKEEAMETADQAEAPSYQPPVPLQSDKKVVQEVKLPRNVTKKKIETLDEILAKMERGPSNQRRESTGDSPLPSSARASPVSHPPPAAPVIKTPVEPAASIAPEASTLSKTENHLEPVWHGKLTMPQVGKFSGYARQVCGRRIGDAKTWTNFLADALIIEGRIPTDRAIQYISDQSLGSKQVVVIELFPGTPDQQSDDEDSQLLKEKSDFNVLLDYFASRDRFGVVKPHPSSGLKDMYIVPLKPDQAIPDYMESLADNMIKKSRETDSLLAVLILKTQGDVSKSRPLMGQSRKVKSREGSAPPVPTTYVPPQPAVYPTNLPLPTNTISSHGTSGLLASLMGSAPPVPTQFAIPPQVDVSALLRNLQNVLGQPPPNPYQ